MKLCIYAAFGKLLSNVTFWIIIPDSCVDMFKCGEKTFGNEVIHLCTFGTISNILSLCMCPHAVSKYGIVALHVSWRICQHNVFHSNF